MMYNESVESLQRLYSIIIAIAIAIAINNSIIIDGEVNLHQLVIKLPQFLAFAVTIIPFYHGMDIHLNNAYKRPDSNPISGAIIIDFLVFFIESFLLIGISVTMKADSIISTYFIITLLFFDAGWAFVSYYIHYRKRRATNVWSLINIICGGVLILVCLINVFDTASAQLWSIAVILFLRTVFDYFFTWDFYFPSDK